MGVCVVFFKVAYIGFYRRYPALANIFSFALECWYLALIVVFILARLIKSVFATGLYVRRTLAGHEYGELLSMKEGLLLELWLCVILGPVGGLELGQKLGNNEQTVDGWHWQWW